MVNSTLNTAASAVTGIMAERADKKRKAGTKIAEFKKYLDSFDRTADGAGSEKGTDRFSGKDIRTAFDNRGNLSKAEGARMVLDYALDSATDGSKMGGSSLAALDKLRGYVKAAESKPKPNKPKPTPNKPKPTPDPEPTPEPTPAPPSNTVTDSIVADNISGDIFADPGSVVNNPVGNNNFMSTYIDSSRREGEGSDYYYPSNLDDFKFDADDFKKSYMAKLLNK